MGAELLDTSPVFTHPSHPSLRTSPEHTRRLWSLTDVIRQTPHAPTLDRVDVVQPTTFALMVALARLWQHHGITPDAVIGHSQGEIAAAHIAGALTLQDAARIVTLRSQAIARHLAGHGAMLSIPLPAHHITPHLTDGLHIATHNGPHSTVAAGDPTAINTLHHKLTHTGIRTRLIPVDYASHTPHVETIEEELRQLLAPITAQTPTTPMYSTTDRDWITDPSLNAEYWYRNLRQQVHFHHGITTLTDTGHHTYIEISTHPVLTPAIEDTDNTTAIPTLRRNQPEPLTFHHSLPRPPPHHHPPHPPLAPPHPPTPPSPPTPSNTSTTG
ncbi:acyltransferase domain-containing protein [Streptomyces sp. R39]|uniref:Acyltransferase domain-containing protein n=1 Tax=Streptomyces sp. R39 TaxID=3238631 RepID=A0AB39R5T8_9ACTN